MRIKSNYIKYLLVVYLGLCAGCDQDADSGQTGDTGLSTDTATSTDDSEAQSTDLGSGSFDILSGESDNSGTDMATPDPEADSADPTDVATTADTTTADTTTADTTTPSTDTATSPDTDNSGDDVLTGQDTGTGEPDASDPAQSWIPTGLEKIDSGTTANLYGAWIDSDGALWVVGYGVLRRLGDDGWTDQLAGYPNDPNSLTTVSGRGNLLAVADNHLVYRKDTDGWTPVFESANCAGNIDLFILPSGTTIVGCPYYSGLGRFDLPTGTGAEHMDIGSFAITRDVWAFADDDVYALSGDSSDLGLKHYTGGDWAAPESWDNIPLGIKSLSLAPTAMTGLDSGDLVIVGGDGSIVRVQNGQALPEDSGTNTTFNDVWSMTNGATIAVGRDGEVVYNAGLGWVPLKPVSTADLKAVTGTVGGIAYAVGNEGTIVRIVHEPLPL